jgi:hypothetical protein
VASSSLRLRVTKSRITLSIKSRTAIAGPTGRPLGLPGAAHGLTFTASTLAGAVRRSSTISSRCAGATDRVRLARTKMGKEVSSIRKERRPRMTRGIMRTAMACTSGCGLWSGVRRGYSGGRRYGGHGISVQNVGVSEGQFLVLMHPLPWGEEGAFDRAAAPVIVARQGARATQWNAA